ncbi:nucleotidyltransferase family protein [Paenibacillus tundrae]|uniref:nucleotidyltransferase family protein n=1 Tax=Paenibacillus tundrae TaxID=528187 RepID=UPI0030CCAFD0
MGLTGILLAAGKSSRLGRDKLSVVMPDGRSLATWSLEAALGSKLERVICVVKPEDILSWIPRRWLCSASYAYQPEAKLVISVCDAYAMGMAHSLHCGIRNAEQYEPDGYMVMLADQPLIETQQINEIITTFETNKQSDYVAATDCEDGKPPVAFRSHLLAQLLSLRGDEGARRIMRNSQFTGTYVSLPAPSFWDADTEDELERIVHYMEHLHPSQDTQLL